MKYDLVCAGGGCKLPAIVGALQAIEANEFEPNGCAGTSAGAIVAAFRAVGYSPSDLADIVYNLDFSQFKDGAPWGTKAYHLLKNKGIYKGDYFLEQMRGFVENKGVKYFGDLDRPLHVYAADVSNGRLIQLPGDMKQYGFDPDRVEIAWAVRTSMSIPFFFRPVKINLPSAEGQTYFVDGGLLSNFPIDTFDVRHRPPKFPTFGIRLWEDNAGQKREVKKPGDFIGSVFNTMLSAHDRELIREGDYEQRTIRVPVGDTSTTDFNLSFERKHWLVNNGRIAANAFLANWSFDNYVKWACETRGIKQ